MGTLNYLSPLKIGDVYDRPILASLWGLAGHQAISRGVFTPARTNLIFLFVTRIKQTCLTQYRDFMCEDVLQWEGEERHANDTRIANASKNGDEIHLFYRELHHTPFTYHGRIILVSFISHDAAPSEFAFEVISKSVASVGQEPSSAKEDGTAYAIATSSTLNGIDKRILAKTRGIAQTFFRSNLLKLWDGACSVTGVSDPRVLRASHIKPWKDSSSEEKLDRNNGLLLIPDLDALFDEGMITFQTDGAMRQSPSFSVADKRKMRIDRSFRLRHVTDEMKPYLEYHREQRFVC